MREAQKAHPRTRSMDHGKPKTGALEAMEEAASRAAPERLAANCKVICFQIVHGAPPEVQHDGGLERWEAEDLLPMGATWEELGFTSPPGGEDAGDPPGSAP